jgi:low temperature requirement protein LtrA
MARKKKTKETSGKAIQQSKIANIFALIASAILVLFGLFAVFFSSEIQEAAKDIPQITSRFILTYGIIWIILGVLVYTVNKSIIRSNDKSMKWFLLVLGIASLITGRLEGILVIIASLVYIIKK